VRTYVKTFIYILLQLLGKIDVGVYLKSVTI
jgi:hypothetical protein